MNEYVGKKYGAENEAGVFYATTGYYKGKKVTITHHDGANVWLEDYPVGKNPIEYGCWVSNDSVSYIATDDNKVNFRQPKRSNKKVTAK